MKRARHLLGEIDAGRYVPGAVQTFRQYVGTWLSSRSLSPTTRRGYEVLLRCHLLPALGDLNLQKIEAAHIAEVLARLTDAGHVTMAQRAYRLLSTIYVSAMRSGAAGSNPVSRLDCPRPERKEMVSLTPDQVAQILAELARRNHWALPAIALAFTSGLRRSEFAALRWSDFDADAALIHVRRAVHFMRDGQVVVRQPKSRQSRRAVALDSGTVAMLSAHKLKCEREAG